MAVVKNFEDLDTWKAAKDFYIRTKNLIDRTAIRQEFYLKDQLLRSALSISNNVAEGFERGGTKEFRRYLIIANGSAAEAKSMLLIISEVYTDLDQSLVKDLLTLAQKSINLNKGLIRYLNTRDK